MLESKLAGMDGGHLEKDIKFSKFFVHIAIPEVIQIL